MHTCWKICCRKDGGEATLMFFSYATKHQNSHSFQLLINFYQQLEKRSALLIGLPSSWLIPLWGALEEGTTHTILRLPSIRYWLQKHILQCEKSEVLETECMLSQTRTFWEDSQLFKSLTRTPLVLAFTARDVTVLILESRLRKAGTNFRFTFREVSV